MVNEKLYQVALSMVPGIGDVIAKTLVSYCGSASEVFKKNKNHLSKIPGIGTVNAEKILSFKKFYLAEKEIEKCHQAGYQIHFFTDEAYPKKLKHAPDSPTILYYNGTANLNNPKTIAIVGTRKSTSYGKKITQQLIEQLAPHNPLIVSGLAYGIDIEAHKGALAHGLKTIGVMASGLDIVYPSAHRGIAKKMLENGGLITEQKIGDIPDAFNFPARNRIIAGMSDVTIVVEAAAKGGALITAEIANSYSRDVFAVPGDIGKAFSEGCNNLIKSNKAHLLTSAKDIEYIMNWESYTQNPASDQKYFDINKLTAEEKKIVETLQPTESMALDELSWKSQIPLNKLASVLLNMEFNGIVKPLPGKKYKMV